MPTALNPTLPGDQVELQALLVGSNALNDRAFAVLHQLSSATGALGDLAVNASEDHQSVCTTTDVAGDTAACAETLAALAADVAVLAGDLAASDALARHTDRPASA